MIRVVIGEDSYIVREGISEGLSAQDGIDVAGAPVATTSRWSWRKRMPTVVITDIRMPVNEDEGVKLAAHLRTAHPEVGVVLLSRVPQPEFALRLFEDGSEGRGIPC